MSIFFDLFSPGHRHRADEQERLEHTREVEGLGEPGRGPIDLGSGVVLIKPSASSPGGPEADGPADDDEAAGADEDAGAEAEVEDEDELHAAAPKARHPARPVVARRRYFIGFLL